MLLFPIKLILSINKCSLGCMKLKYLHSGKTFNNSFSVVRHFKPHLESDRHIHDEYELIYIAKGTGIRIAKVHAHSV